MWIREGYSIRQLTAISGHSRAKLTRVKNYWLGKLPQEQIKFSRYKYIVYDGTYFHKNGCFICLINAQNSSEVFSNIYARREDHHSIVPWLFTLKRKGLNPKYVVMDGEKTVMQAFKEIWPDIKIQRCLWHIQREGMRWLRTYPKTQAGRDLRFLLSTLCAIRSRSERDVFIERFNEWLEKHLAAVRRLPSANIAYKDLKKAMTLIYNALPDMFHFLEEPLIPSTTNLIEGYYSRLKADYRRHRGLSEKHKIHYLKWYAYLKNTNTK